jgi:hypothetical protein
LVDFWSDFSTIVQISDSPSNPWDLQPRLSSDYTPGSADYSPHYTNSVLANPGSQLTTTCLTSQSDRVSSGSSPEDSDPRDCFDPVDGDRSGIVIDSTGLATLVRGALLCSNQILEQGDYVYIDLPPPDQDRPGLLVVGWGPIVNCSDAFGTIRTINDFTATRDDSHPVPYVSDCTTEQPPIARPFYCTMAFDDGYTGTCFYRHDWFFFDLPDSINLNQREVCVNSDWNW